MRVFEDIAYLGVPILILVGLYFWGAYLKRKDIREGKVRPSAAKPQPVNKQVITGITGTSTATIVTPKQSLWRQNRARIIVLIICLILLTYLFHGNVLGFLPQVFGVAVIIILYRVFRKGLLK